LLNCFNTFVEYVPQAGIALRNIFLEGVWSWAKQKAMRICLLTKKENRRLVILFFGFDKMLVHHYLLASINSAVRTIWAL
jgi:hypothetical protein